MIDKILKSCVMKKINHTKFRGIMGENNTKFKISLTHKSFKRPQDIFNGTWKEVSKTNIEEFLKKMGYYWAVRKVAIAMGMTLVIKG